MILLTVDKPSDRAIREGQLVFAVAISAANILRDLREHITNTLGGHMTRYERLADETIERALASLKEKAGAAGYDGVCGLIISHPKVAEGGVEVVVYGTGFRFA